MTARRRRAVPLLALCLCGSAFAQRPAPPAVIAPVRVAVPPGEATGEWKGDVLVVTTTHLKIGWIRRNGVPRSDRATLTEHWVRHGDQLTLVSIVHDPVYLTEPFLRTTDFEMDLHQQIDPYPCEAVEEVPRPQGYVPHYPFGTRQENFAKHFGLPIEAVQGGKETIYPEYELKMRKAIADMAAKPAAK